MNKFKNNALFSEAELNREATVANFATVQKQNTKNRYQLAILGNKNTSLRSQLATSREKSENLRFKNDTSGEYVCYRNHC